MGWKGTVRSLQAASNAADRERQRRQREYQRQQAELSKMADLERAAAEVRIFDSYIHSLETVHAIEVSSIDWADVASVPQPEMPTRGTSHGDKAESELRSFKPKLMESKKKAASRRNSLEQAIPTARERDEEEYQLALKTHQENVREWRENRELAEGVLRKDVNAFVKAADLVEAITNVDHIKYVDFDAIDSSNATVFVGVEQIDGVVPAEQKSLLASGKLSIKQMPKGRFYEIYQDFVSGSALLTANTVLGLLPIESLIVTVRTEALNTSTGHIEETAILSLFAPRETMARLNLGMVDASDALANFIHNVNFKKTQGFGRVEVVVPPQAGDRR